MGTSNAGTDLTMSEGFALCFVLLMVTLNEGNPGHYPSYELASALYKVWSQPSSFTAWQQGQRFARAGFPRMAEGGDIYDTPEGLPLGPPKA